MRKKNLTVVALAALLLLSTMGAAMAAGFGHHGKGGMGEGRGEPPFWTVVLRAVNPLNFTEDQWKKTDELLVRVREEGEAFHEAFGRHHDALKAVVCDEKGYDEKKAQEALQTLRPEFVRVLKSFEVARNDLYGMLDAGQKERLGSILAVIEEHFAEGERGPGREFGRRMMRGLGMTAAQQDEAKKIVDASKPLMQEKVQGLVNQLKEERELLKAGPMNQEQMDASVEKIADRVEEMALEMAKNHAAIWRLLTPEQREKAEHMRSMFRGMHGMHRGE